MIASAVPGEGKTFTTMNLALSLTRERDLKVVLVDADVAKPHISRVLGVESDLGLLDALQDSALDVESLVLPTTNPSLWVLPAGKRSENATELLASSRMDEIAKRLMQVDANRVVIIDSPPILLTTESHALANVAGQIVVVVRADSTPRNTVLDALSHVGNHPGVSLLLNQTSTGSNTGNYYHYGYDEKGLNAGQT
jgi:Mrp family chromosome partitioning ATPase